MKIYLLMQKRTLSNGRTYSEVIGAYTSSNRAHSERTAIAEAYLGEDSADSASFALFSSLYPECASEVRFSDQSKFGFWVETLEANLSPSDARQTVSV